MALPAFAVRPGRVRRSSASTLGVLSIGHGLLAHFVHAPATVEQAVAAMERARHVHGKNTSEGHAMEAARPGARTRTGCG